MADLQEVCENRMAGNRAAGSWLDEEVQCI